MKINLQTKTIIVWVFLVIFTILAIYFIYGKFLFNKWSWFRASIIISTFTCLWVYTCWFFHWSIADCYNEKTAQNEQLIMVMFTILIVPINVMLFYPGLKTLGLHSDWKAYYLVFSLVVIHGIGFYIIQRWIKQFLGHRYSSKMSEDQKSN